MPPKSETASARRRPRQTTPGPSNAEILGRLDFMTSVLGMLLLALHTRMPQDLMLDIVARCGIPVTHWPDLESDSLH